MLSGTLGEILNVLSGSLSSYPRKTPGVLQVEGRPLSYVDLHSFYHQCIQIFAQNLYDFESSVSTPLILDCGAHIGIASLFFSTRYPSGRIIAFEADPEIAATLERNVQSFGLTNVEVSAKAVWVDDDGVCFRDERDDSGHVDNVSAGVRIPSVRLRTVLANSTVELLKLDVEGAEYALLKDCADSLVNVKKIIVEVHQLRNEGSLGELLLILEKAGFRYALSDLHQAEWITPYTKPPFTATRTDRFLVSVFAWR